MVIIRQVVLKSNKFKIWLFRHNIESSSILTSLSLPEHKVQKMTFFCTLILFEKARDWKGMKMIKKESVLV